MPIPRSLIEISARFGWDRYTTTGRKPEYNGNISYMPSTSTKDELRDALIALREQVLAMPVKKKTKVYCSSRYNSKH